MITVKKFAPSAQLPGHLLKNIMIGVSYTCSQFFLFITEDYGRQSTVERHSQLNLLCER